MANEKTEEKEERPALVLVRRRALIQIMFSIVFNFSDNKIIAIYRKPQKVRRRASDKNDV